MWLQKTVILSRRSRGFHLITAEILEQLPELKGFSLGTAHLFLQHSSASLCVNENADPAVRRDMERHFSLLVPDGAAHFEHDSEGPDDMPAHIKSVLLGCSLILPISDGKLALGTWQGIYLGEHRDHAGPRRLIATLNGEEQS